MWFCLGVMQIIPHLSLRNDATEFKSNGRIQVEEIRDGEDTYAEHARCAVLLCRSQGRIAK